MTYKKPKKTVSTGKPELERAVEIACKRLSKGALMVLENAIDETKTPNLEMRWRLAAAKEILDRAWGRPKQSIDANIKMETAESLVDAIKSARQNAAVSSVLEAAQEQVH